VNVRTLIASHSASCRSVSGSCSRASAHSRARPVPVAPSSGTGCSMYCACPPSRCGGTTDLRATRFATATPKSTRVMCRHRSNPEATPADVSTRPSSVYSTSGSRRTSG
jgi:hypothetical protein